MNHVLGALSVVAVIVGACGLMYGAALLVGLGRCRVCRKFIPPTETFCAAHAPD